MPVDDPLDVRIRQYEEATNLSIQRGGLDAAIAGILSLFPIGGACIQSLLFDKAQRNNNQRVLELFTEMRERLEEIKALIPDQEYFGSEEFQTLLALALEQIQTTHDRTKRKQNTGDIDTTPTSLARLVA
jgi:hypothetical protein